MSSMLWKLSMCIRLGVGLKARTDNLLFPQGQGKAKDLAVKAIAKAKDLACKVKAKDFLSVHQSAV